MKTKFYIAGIVSLMASGQICALTPDEVASRIISNSPLVSVSRTESELARLTARSETNLPDPEVEGEFLVPSSSDGTTRWGAGVSWNLEWPGVYQTRKDMARSAASVADLGVAVAETQLYGEVRELLLTYMLQQRQMDIYREMSVATDSVATLVEKRGRAGDITRLDLNKLAVERATFRASMSELSDAMLATAGELDRINGSDCSGLLELLDHHFDIKPAYLSLSEAPLYSPALMEAEAKVKTADDAVRLARREGLPEIGIGYRHAYEEGMHFNGASLGISIPLFSSRGKRKVAEAARRLEVENVHNLRTQTELQISTERKRLQNLLRQYDTIAPSLDNGDNLELIMKALRGGELTVVDYLNERRYFMEAYLSLLNLEYSIVSTASRIRTLTGNSKGL